METKKISIPFEKVKVVEVQVDLENLENYMSKFLALKNNQRNTSEILDVRGFDDSNVVKVVLLIEENEPEEKEVELCRKFVGQFGKIISCKVETAWILNDSYSPGLYYLLNSKDEYCEWYVYRY